MRLRRYNQSVMRYKGVVKNGVIVLEPGAKLPEGTEVRVEVVRPPTGNLGERLMKHAGILDDLPADMAENHDHYIHGQPRRTLLERLSSIVGKAEGLPPDAASNIDRDLYGRPAE